MSVFAISDLHLSLNASTNKSMEVYGHRWRGYVDKLTKHWRAIVGENDTIIIPGDISWALTLEEAVPDFAFINSLPGKKLIGKGNHDFWWQTLKKLNAFTEKYGFSTVSFLYNNAFLVEDLIVAGTRGWFYDSSSDNIPEGTDFAKIVAREAIRLEMSLNEASKLKALHPEKELAVFLHFPVVWSGRTLNALLALLLKYDIRHCYFGHIHSTYDMPTDFVFEGIQFHLISADFLSFIPKIIQK